MPARRLLVALTAIAGMLLIPTAAHAATKLPPGVTTKPIDGGPAYYAKWANSFPASVFPVGVFPFEASPASLHAIGVNYGTPMRNDQAGTWSPVYNCAGCVNSQTDVNAQPGFYSGGDYEGAGSPAWGARAVFNVFGDELDGQCKAGLFDDNPSNVSSAASQCGSWGGTTASGLEAANKASRSNDPSRPVYDQVTVTFTGLTQDGSYGSQYSTADQQAVCASTDILSFDLYPLVKRGEPVYDTYNDVAQMRSMCRDARPVFPFIEMDHMDGGNIYPLPAQTVAEVWNAVIAGAGGVQYFDQYGALTSSSYTGGGHYPAGAMYQTIKATDGELAALASVLHAPTASGFVTSTGNIKTMVKDLDGHWYLFAAPHAQGVQTVTFTIPSGFTTAAGLNGTASATITGRTFKATFASANQIDMWEIS